MIDNPKPKNVQCAPVACDCGSIRFRSTGEVAWTSEGIYRERECLAPGCEAESFWTLEVRIAKLPGDLRTRHKPERTGMRPPRQKLPRCSGKPLPETLTQ